MPKFSVEIWGMMLMGYNKALDTALCRGSDLGLAPEIYRILRNIKVAMITYLKLKQDTFGVT